MPAAVFGLALALRLIHLAEIQGTALYQVPHGDGRAYIEWADRIRAEGLLEGREVWYQAPLYPHVLASIRALGGESLLVIRCVQAVLGAAAAAFVCAAGRRVFGPWPGLVAGLLVALSPTSIWLDGLVQKSALAGVLVAIGLWLGTFSGTRARVLLGVTLGLLALTRGELRLWLFACLAVLLATRDRRGALAFAAGAALALAPALARNVAVAGSWTLTTSQAGPNLFIGNGPGATGVYRPLVPGRSDARNEAEDARRLAMEESGAAQGEAFTAAEVSRHWRGRALRALADDPPRAAALLGRKALLALNVAEVADTDDLAHAAERSSVLGSPVSFRLVLCLALMGVLAPRVRGRAWPTAALAACQLTALVLFYVSARYRLPLTLALCPVAGAGAMHLRRAFVDRPWRALALLVAGFTVSSLPVVDRDAGRAAALINEAVALSELDRAAEADEALMRALALAPGDVGALRTLARLRMRAGDSRGALPILEDLARGGAGDWQLMAWLGMARADSGDRAGARGPLERAALERPRALPIITNAVSLALADGDLPRVVRLCEARLAVDDGPSSVRFRLQLAWIRATASVPELRDGAQAVALTEGLGGGPEVASVRAAALAEAGRFDEARSVVLDALRATGGAGDDPGTRHLEAQAAAYAAGTPWREGPPAASLRDRRGRRDRR